MGMLPLKNCTRCYTAALRGSKFCARHQNANRDRDREYKAASTTRKFKNTKAWAIARRFVLFRDPQCGGALNGVRCLQLAEHVHHVIRAEEFVAAGGHYCDPANLIGLCPACHSRETAREVGFGGRHE